MARVAVWTGALAVAGMLAGCQALMKPPELELTGLQTSALGLDGATLTAQLQVRNPNFYDVKPVRITYDLVVEGAPAGKGVLEKEFVVPAGQKVPLEFPVKVGWGAAMGALKSAFSKGTVESKTTGVITVSTLVGLVEVPYEISGRIQNGEPPPPPQP